MPWTGVDYFAVPLVPLSEPDVWLPEVVPSVPPPVVPVLVSPVVPVVPVVVPPVVVPVEGPRHEFPTLVVGVPSGRHGGLRDLDPGRLPSDPRG